MRMLARPVTIVAIVATALSAACAPKVVPVPVVTTPRFPDFVQPAVPAELAATLAAQTQERAWRFLQAGDLRNADRELELALQIDPAFYPAEAAAGYVELARSQANAALQRFDRVLAQRADYVPALVGRGQALVGLEREAEAIQAFEAAVAADPSLAHLTTRVEVLRFRAQERDLAAARQAARAGNRDEAIKLYRSAIGASPESPFLYRELANVEGAQGDEDAALEHFRQAIALDPADTASMVRVAELLDKRGDADAALRTYDDVLATEASESVLRKRDELRGRIELAQLPEEYRAIAAAEQLTRADLAALVGVRLRSALTGVGSGDAVLVTDVRGNWAEPWIMMAVSAGIIDAFDNHTFQPRSPVTRAELAEAVSRLLPHVASEAQVQAWQKNTVRFSDLAPGHLAFPAAAVATASGVLLRLADGSFGPSRPVTGAEGAAAVEHLRTMMPLTAFSR
jgi:tetratricopeptide (TPR) repeat protein